MRGTWQTTDSGGGALAEVVVLIIVVAAFGPAVAAAVAELVHVVLIVAVVLAALAVAGLVALAAFRVHRSRVRGTAQVSLPAPSPWRAVQSARKPRRAIERGGQLHLHLHGVSAEDIAAILDRHNGKDHR